MSGTGLRIHGAVAGVAGRIGTHTVVAWLSTGLCLRPGLKNIRRVDSDLEDGDWQQAYCCLLVLVSCELGGSWSRNRTPAAYALQSRSSRAAVMRAQPCQHGRPRARRVARPRKAPPKAGHTRSAVRTAPVLTPLKKKSQPQAERFAVVGASGMAAVRGATAAEKREMGVKAADEEKKGSRAAEKGATAEGKGVAAVDKGGKGSSSKATDKGKGPTAEGKGKKRDTAEDEKDAAAEWKWKLKGPTAADEEKGEAVKEEVPNPRRERRMSRSTRREGGAAVGKDQAGTAAASEVAGEKATFVFSAAAAAAPDAGKMITLVSSEGKAFKVSEDAARLSTVLEGMIDNGCAGGDIPVPNATARALATVIKYCEKHADDDPDHGGGSSSTAASDKETLAEWDRKLVDNLSTNALFDLLLATNFLDIKGLLGVASQKVADMIQSKTPEQVRTIFGIANDFTPEEEAKIRGESPWAYEDI
ncbi:hypothetical protein HU200_046009 [Digitaria exilis]|uniref:SKP1-like protein n=1 Tax=Digitaria exilis TaxID=1010633 RepID=A0A835AYS5_9POAL|nr:hypothetical protein HU200_046009 [Digitaria exilis]